jgi:hypothetical protein
MITPAAFAYAPFPLNVLPEPVRSFVRESARALGCDPVLIALPTLAALASCVGTTRCFKLKPTWREFRIIWAALIAESGSLKSPAQRYALATLAEIQAAAFAA